MEPELGEEVAAPKLEVIKAVLEDMKAALGEAIKSKNLSHIEDYVDSSIVEMAQKKIDAADDKVGEEKRIFDSLQCFKDYITDDLLTNSKLNEDDYLKEKMQEAINQCASDDFKAALGIPDQ